MPEQDLSREKKGRLGRGLGSLLGEVEIELPRSPVKEVEKGQVDHFPIGSVIPNPNQPRKVFQKERLGQLALSIKEKGILQPIVVRPTLGGKFEIVAGERRWRAAQMAGLTAVPVIVRKTNDRDSLELALIENIQRDQLNPIEEAEAYLKLQEEYGLTQEVVAQRVGKERSTVANILRLLDLCPEAKRMVSEEKLTSGHAKVLLSVENPVKQRELARIIEAQGLSVRATEKLVAQIQRQKNSSDQPQSLGGDVAQRLAKGLAEELQRALGTRVQIDYRGGKGKLSINFYSDEALSNLAERLKAAWKSPKT